MAYEVFICSGRDLHLNFLPNLVGKVSSSLLEFLVEIFFMWADIAEGRMDIKDLILSFGDNPSSISVLHKSSFNSEDQLVH